MVLFGFIKIKFRVHAGTTSASYRRDKSHEILHYWSEVRSCSSWKLRKEHFGIRGEVLTFGFDPFLSLKHQML